ncbi:hypothetical protein CY35_01G135900 [Sphagnum magellanicum]|nr:hypothetical protein CY35_01G135900 [Sphagnum magellanicum]
MGDYCHEDIPGPGAYSPLDKHTAPTAPAYSLPARLNNMQQQTNLNPGPGTYTLREGLNKGPAYSFAARVSPVGKDSTPGPGTYQNSVDFTKASPPSYSLADRLNKQQDQKTLVLERIVHMGIQMVQSTLWDNE